MTKKLLQLIGVLAGWHLMCLGSWFLMAIITLNLGMFLSPRYWWGYWVITTVIPIGSLIFVGLGFASVVCVAMVYSIFSGNFEKDFWNIK